jgi:hypothetical protein
MFNTMFIYLFLVLPLITDPELQVHSVSQTGQISSKSPSSSSSSLTEGVGGGGGGGGFAFGLGLGGVGGKRVSIGTGFVADFDFDDLPFFLRGVLLGILPISFLPRPEKKREVNI